MGHNHVNETARHRIVIAHRLWEENLGNMTKVFVNNSFGFVARFSYPNSLGRTSPGKMGQGIPYQRVQATIPKESLMKTWVTSPQIFLPQRSHALQFCLRDCAHSLYRVLLLNQSKIVTSS